MVKYEHLGNNYLYFQTTLYNNSYIQIIINHLFNNNDNLFIRKKNKTYILHKY